MADAGAVGDVEPLTPAGWSGGVAGTVQANTGPRDDRKWWHGAGTMSALLDRAVAEVDASLEREARLVQAAADLDRKLRELIKTCRTLQGADPDTGDWVVSALALLEVLDEHRDGKQ